MSMPTSKGKFSLPPTITGKITVKYQRVEENILVKLLNEKTGSENGTDHTINLP